MAEVTDGISSVPVQAAEERTTPAKPLGTSKKKFRTPKPVPGLEFTSGDTPLKDYFDEHAPKKETKKYLVCTQWLKQYRGIMEVGADHIYSCYRALNMNTPRDVLSVYRSLKKQGWVEDGATPGTYKITHIGENQLNQGNG